MKSKQLTLLALTTCTIIVIGTGFARAVFLPEMSQVPITVLAQTLPEESSDLSTVTEAVNQTTLDYLRSGRETLPQSPTIRRTVIDDSYALVTWVWGEAGGQAALALTDDGWGVLTSGGGALSQSVLEEVGVPAATAETLIESDQAAWE